MLLQSLEHQTVTKGIFYLPKDREKTRRGTAFTHSDGNPTLTVSLISPA